MNTITVTQENFQKILLEDSKEKLVMIDFWADWCGPCKQLIPILEKLAEEYKETLVLAKVDCDKEQVVAAQFGIQSLPTVVLIKDGEPVDGFAGLQPEPVIRELLDKYLPKPWDALFEKGQTLLSEGKAAEAMTLLNTTFEQSGQRTDIRFALIQAYINMKRIDEADNLLQGVKLEEQNSEFQHLSASLHLLKEAADSPEIRELTQRIQQEPNNLELKHQLAVQYHQAGKTKEAFELLFKLFTKDSNALTGKVQNSIVEILQSLPKGDELATKYQRRFYTLMH